MIIRLVSWLYVYPSEPTSAVGSSPGRADDVSQGARVAQRPSPWTECLPKFLPARRVDERRRKNRIFAYEFTQYLTCMREFLLMTNASLPGGGVLKKRFVTSTTAPVATNWSDSCCAGLSLTEDTCFCTAHCNIRAKHPWAANGDRSRQGLRVIRPLQLDLEPANAPYAS